MDAANSNGLPFGGNHIVMIFDACDSYQIINFFVNNIITEFMLILPKLIIKSNYELRESTSRKVHPFSATPLMGIWKLPQI